MESNPSVPPTSQFKLIKAVGRGTSSTVYWATRSLDSQEVALKTLQSNNFSLEKKMIIHNDASVIGKVQGHPNIIRFEGNVVDVPVEWPDGTVAKLKEAMVLESLRGGELYFHFKMNGAFSPETSRYFVKQLIEATMHMHRCGYAHRDIKPWNLMFSDDLMQIKVIDFGYATPLTLTSVNASSDIEKCLAHYLSGTKRYLAPELYEQDVTGSLAKSDSFAIGVILYNFLTGKYPFKDVFHQEYDDALKDPSKYIEESQLKSQKEKEDLNSLLKGLWIKEQDDRLPLSKALEHPWIKNYTISNAEEVKDEFIKRLSTSNLSLKNGPHILDDNFESEIQLDSTHFETYQEFSVFTTVIKTTLSIQSLLYKLEHLSKELLGTLSQISSNSLRLEIQTSTAKLQLSQMLVTALVFFNGPNKTICFEMVRESGDYLSFMDLFCILSKHFS